MAVVVVPSERGSEVIRWTSNAGYHRSTSPLLAGEDDRVRECQLVGPPAQPLPIGEVGLAERRRRPRTSVSGRVRGDLRRRVEEVLEALHRIEARDGAHHGRLRGNPQLLAKLAAAIFRGHEPRGVHGREVDESRHQQGFATTMKLDQCLAVEHDRVGEAADEQHRRATKQRRRARVDDLPDDRGAGSSSGDSGVRVDEPADLDDIGVRAIDRCLEPADARPEVAHEPQ